MKSELVKSLERLEIPFEDHEKYIKIHQIALKKTNRKTAKTFQGDKNYIGSINDEYVTLRIYDFLGMLLEVLKEKKK